MNATKENDYTCGTCKYCGYCDKQDELDIYDLNTCDDWTEDKDELSEQEKADIRGDKKYHEMIETEGYVE